jgi:hypothetical protein
MKKEHDHQSNSIQGAPAELSAVERPLPLPLVFYWRELMWKVLPR